MKKVWMSLLAGMCIMAVSNGVLAGNNLINEDIPAENASKAGKGVSVDMEIKLISTSKDPRAQKDLVVEMRDMMGKYIYTTAAGSTLDGQPVFDTDIPPLPAGFYSYNVYDSNNNLLATGKYIKE